MAVVYVPVRIMSLQLASNPGNVYWKKITMTTSGYEYQIAAMKPNVSSKIFGKVLIPANIKTVANGGFAPDLRIRWLTTATSGNVRLQTSFNVSGQTTNINDLAFNTETLQSPGASGFVRDINELEQPLTNQPANGGFSDEAGSEMFVVLFRDGANAGDTIEQDVELLDWYYRCEI